MHRDSKEKAKCESSEAGQSAMSEEKEAGKENRLVEQAAQESTKDEEGGKRRMKRKLKDEDSSLSADGFMKDLISDGQFKVAILFLAHDGVANPDIWQKWKDFDPALHGRISFHVFRNATEALMYQSGFVDEYDVGLRLPTRWCDSNTCYAVVMALRKVLDRDLDARIIYVVSGRDLPLQSARELFMERRVFTEGVQYVLQPWTTIFCKARDDVIESLSEPRNWGTNNENVRRHLLCHNTFFAIQREHAKMLAGFEKGLLRDLLKLGNHKSLQKHSCPEEWVLGTALRMAGMEEDGFVDWPLTDQVKAEEDDPSPITWSSYTEERSIVWGPGHKVKITLEKLMKNSRAEGNLFFRKVGPLPADEAAEFAAAFFPMSERRNPPRPNRRSSSSSRTPLIETGRTSADGADGLGPRSRRFALRSRECAAHGTCSIAQR